MQIYGIAVLHGSCLFSQPYTANRKSMGSNNKSGKILNLLPFTSII